MKRDIKKRNYTSKRVIELRRQELASFNNKKSKLQKTMQSTQTIETARGRKETGTSYVSHDVTWLTVNYE